MSIFTWAQLQIHMSDINRKSGLPYEMFKYLVKIVHDQFFVRKKQLCDVLGLGRNSKTLNVILTLKILV